jgi:hypothetical protein
MKRFRVPVFLLCLTLAAASLVGCGTSSANPANINGNWNATLTNSGNQTLFQFGTSLVVNGDGSLGVSNFTFTSNSACFESAETESGSFTLNGNFNGQVSGTFGFTMQSSSPSGNTLALNGTANGNTISGSWQLTGSAGCAGNGTFIMTKA